MERHLQTSMEVWVDNNKAGVIEPSCTELASPSVLVRKRDGSVRWCIDLRKFNDDLPVKYCYHLPLLQDSIDALGDANILCSKRHSLQAGELSQWTQAAVQIVSNLHAPSNGGPIYRFCHVGHADPLDGWRFCSQNPVMLRQIQVRQL